VLLISKINKIKAAKDPMLINSKKGSKKEIKKKITIPNI
jgi:hypothetical protein